MGSPPSEKLHKMFYRGLRELGFRSHHASEIYKRAKEVVEASKRNKGSGSVLGILTARICVCDYKINLGSKILRLLS